PRKAYFPAKSFWHSRIPIIIHLIFFLLFVVACSSADPPIQCAAQSSEAALPPSEDAACVCVDNWTGPECRVCTDDSVCGSGQLCRHALPMYQRLEGVCNIFTKGFADFLGGAGTLALQMGMTDSEGATPAPDAGLLDLTVFANPSPGIFRPVFSCAGRQCLLSKEKDSPGAAGGARVGMQCQQSSCTALCDKAEDAFCIDLMLQLLASIGETGTLDLICEADGDSCVMHEAVLDAYFKGIVFDECRLGECAPRNAGNMTLQELSSFALPPSSPSVLFRLNQALALAALLLVLGSSLATLLLYRYSRAAVDALGSVEGAMEAFAGEGAEGKAPGGSRTGSTDA
ncbi:hypothetical protein NGA_0167501, partial [Nannochloropsis gaditana CCMP526]|uniref:uncharacterized protein n=1 Tax=Nannochloropsis gaditana (strain CCMP526) TaxID=1093141 RepID=UPI00029F7227